MGRKLRRRFAPLVALAVLAMGCPFVHAQTDHGPAAPVDAISGVHAQLAERINVAQPLGESEPELAAGWESASAIEAAELDGVITDAGEPVTDTPPGVFAGDDPLAFAVTDTPSTPTIEVPPITPLGFPILAKLNFTPPEGARGKVLWTSTANYIEHGSWELYLWARPGNHTLSALVVVVTDTAIETYQLSVSFIVGDPPPPKPLSELVSKEQAAELVTRYRAMLVLAFDSADKFYAAHADILAALDLVGSEYETAVCANFKKAGDDAGALLAELEKTIKALGAAPIPPPGPDSPWKDLVPNAAHRAQLSTFYADLAGVVRSGAFASVAHFRAGVQKAVADYQAAGTLPSTGLAGINKPISDRLAAAIGLDDVPLDAAKTAALATVLETISAEFKG